MSGNNSYHGQGPKLKSFKEEVNVSCEPAGSQLLLAQNNSHATVASLGGLLGAPSVRSPMSPSVVKSSGHHVVRLLACLLYTSDAADDWLVV